MQCSQGTWLCGIYTLQQHHAATRCTTLHHDAPRRNTLHHTATHCNTSLQHTATYPRHLAVRDVMGANLSCYSLRCIQPFACTHTSVTNYYVNHELCAPRTAWHEYPSKTPLYSTVCPHTYISHQLQPIADRVAQNLGFISNFFLTNQNSAHAI